MVSLSEAYALAIGHHRAGRMGEAAGLYRAILDADPRQADALHLLGVLSGQIGRTEDAVALIAGAIALDPEAEDYHDTLGSLRRTGGDAVRAVGHHARALALEPARAKAAFNRGLALGDLAREDARPVFLDALPSYQPRIAEAAERSMPIPPVAGGGAVLLVSVDSGYWRRFGRAGDPRARVRPHRLVLRPGRGGLDAGSGGALRDPSRLGAGGRCGCGSTSSCACPGSISR
ncbi:hypothetical protein QSG27_21050 [Azospirillum sp. C340-1]|uniref:Tetratricopeptide repeat protein n=2 Tax=Azospirillum isscasi TaxID=3053926 RepID=A0ABU0WLU6_9PROT|nr:hypothetical protein [Azospirillum isscasi]